MNSIDRISLHSSSRPVEPNCIQRLLNLVWSVVQRILNFFCGCFQATPPHKNISDDLPENVENISAKIQTATYENLPKIVRSALSELVRMKKFSEAELNEDLLEAAKHIPITSQFSETEWLYTSVLAQYFTLKAVEHSTLGVSNFKCALPIVLLAHPDWVKFMKQLDQFAFFTGLGTKDWNHFGLIFIDNVKRTVSFFDSKYKYGNVESDEKALKKLANVLSAEGSEPYTFVRAVTNQSLQRNSHECGVWVCWFLENCLSENPIDFNSLSGDEADRLIADFRKKLRLLIIEDKIKTELQLKKNGDFDPKYHRGKEYPEYGIEVQNARRCWLTANT